VLAAWCKHAADTWFLHNARSALHALWASLHPRTVWLPAYVCVDVAAAVPRDVPTRYYPVGDSLAPDVAWLDAYVRDGDHVLAVDYFGRPPPDDFLAFVASRPRVGWVEDAAQALDAMDRPWGDWLLFSPRKVVGVPDGGILVARSKPLPDLATTSLRDFSFVLPSLARFEDADENDNDRWYADYVRVEAAQRVGIESMSRLSLAMLDACDVSADTAVRRRNYATLHERLAQWAYFTDRAATFTPLGFPVRVPSAEALCASLLEHRIFAARHWRELPSDPAEFPDAHALAGELVTLPCDYRYGDAAMQRVADIVTATLRTDRRGD
jgi:dTDP-4-amino-4,6-dideoxygalactose transaminase